MRAGAWGTPGEVAVQAEFPGSVIQSSLCTEESMLWIGVWKKADHDLSALHGILLAIVKGIAQGL